MTKRLSASEKIARKPASRACVFCHSKHLQCSNERPCKNCVKRNIGHECKDIVRKKAKYMKNKQPSLSGNSSTSNDNTPETKQESENETESNKLFSKPTTETTRSVNHLSLKDVTHSTNAIGQENPILDTTNDVLHRISSNNQMAGKLELSDTPGSIDMFNSNYLNQEYLMLGDIILHSKPASPTPSSSSEVPNFNSITTISSDTLYNSYKDSRPFISLGFSNQIHEQTPIQIDQTSNSNIETTGASLLHDPTRKNPDSQQLEFNISSTPPLSQFAANGYVNPLTTHNMYQKVQDIYNKNIIDFDYPSSYHSLTYFLKQRFSGNDLTPDQKQKKRENLLVILKLIASYRPTFIAAHKSLLKPYDFQFLEMSLQRVLLDCENLSQLNSSPTIIWRRTGEIISFSDDLLSLLGFTMREILSKRTFIMELMYDDESIVNYFKQFKSVAVGNLHSTIYTKCKLTKKSKDQYIEFRSVWTVKRDMFDLPMLIVGQFLPILPAGDGVRMY